MRVTVEIKHLVLIFLLPLFVPAQDQANSFEEDIEHAFVNAKKGVYFALSNIPESKSSLNNDLIEKDILIASVKLSKETNGVKIESVGYYKTYLVEVVVYRSYDSLSKDGYR